MESRLFVLEKLTFSENVRCLNLPLLVGALSQKRSLSLTCFVFACQNFHSGKFKHLKYSENVKFAGTNNFEYILAPFSLVQFCLIFFTSVQPYLLTHLLHYVNQDFSPIPLDYIIYGVLMVPNLKYNIISFSANA